MVYLGLPIKKMVIFHGYVKQPDGRLSVCRRFWKHDFEPTKTTDTDDTEKKEHIRKMILNLGCNWDGLLIKNI